MRDLTELILDGFINGGMPVAVDVHPERRNAVDIPPAVDILYPCSPSLFNDQRLFLHPVGHLSERVPDVTLIDLF